MTQLKSKSGATVFAGIVAIAKEAFYIVKKGNKFIATTKSGEEIGEIVGETVTVSSKIKHTSAGKTVKLANLSAEIDGASLVGKDPTTMSPEELAVLTNYLQEIAKGKVASQEVEEEEVEEKQAKKKKKAAPVEEEEDEFEDVEGDDDEEEEEDEEEKVAPPKGVTNYDELRKLGTKKLWALAKPLALDGINSRSKLDELAAALAEYFGFTMDDEEEEDDAEIVSDSVEDVEDGEEDYEEDEDEEDDEEEEDEDESDEDEDEEDEDESDEDEDEDEEEDDEEEEEDEDEEDYEDDEEEDDDKLTPEDVDALSTKQEIQALMKKHGIKPPTGGKITIGKVKAHIKAELFGE